MNEGKMVQQGTHKELIEVPGPYQDVYRIQYADYLARDNELGAGDPV
jgi:ATP-binding cassette subfamily B protein